MDVHSFSLTKMDSCDEDTEKSTGSMSSDEEKERLLETGRFGNSPGQPELLRSRRQNFWLKIAIGLLVATNVISVMTMALFQEQRQSSRTDSWLPPEHHRTEIFQYQGIFAGEPSAASEEAWTNLIPRGKGFVHIHNTTALAPMPRLDQSLPEQRAMVSVFHQMHCLWIARDSYFKARAGNLDDIMAGHLMHCWDYLRQSIMCAGDTTLEWLGKPPDDKGSTGFGFQHTCKDYGAIYKWADENRVTDTKRIHSPIPS